MKLQTVRQDVILMPKRPFEFGIRNAESETRKTEGEVGRWELKDAGYKAYGVRLKKAKGCQDGIGIALSA